MNRFILFAFILMMPLLIICSCENEVSFDIEYAVVSGKKISRIKSGDTRIYEFSYDDCGRVRNTQYFDAETGKLIKTYNYFYAGNSIIIKSDNSYGDAVLTFDDQGKIINMSAYDAEYVMSYSDNSELTMITYNGGPYCHYVWDDGNVVIMTEYLRDFTEESHFEYSNIIDNFNVQLPHVSWFASHANKQEIELADVRSTYLVSRYGTNVYEYTRNSEGDIDKVICNDWVYYIEYQ